MDLYKLVIGMKLTKGGGGGDDPTIIDPLTVNANGVYSASSGHAFDPVTVSVPSSGITPTGTKNIEENGDYDVTSFASAHVAVPSAFMSAISITENGTYVPSGSVSGFNQVTVNVSGGGGGDHDVEDGIIQRTISGVYTNSRVAEIKPYAFYFCKSLTQAIFSNVTEIGSSAFVSCASIQTISFPKVSMIRESAFYSCRGLNSVNLPSAQNLGAAAFGYCESLTTVILPIASRIGSFCFNGCTYLMSLYLLSTSVASLTNANAFQNTGLSVSTYTGSFGSIYVPASLVDSYKTATNWKTYSARITAYEG